MSARGWSSSSCSHACQSTGRPSWGQHQNARPALPWRQDPILAGFALPYALPLLLQCACALGSSGMSVFRGHDSSCLLTVAPILPLLLPVLPLGQAMGICTAPSHCNRDRGAGSTPSLPRSPWRTNPALLDVCTPAPAPAASLGLLGSCSAATEAPGSRGRCWHSGWACSAPLSPQVVPCSGQSPSR